MCTCYSLKHYVRLVTSKFYWAEQSWSRALSHRFPGSTHQRFWFRKPGKESGIYFLTVGSAEYSLVLWTMLASFEIQGGVRAWPLGTSGTGTQVQILHMRGYMRWREKKQDLTKKGTPFSRQREAQWRVSALGNGMMVTEKIGESWRRPWMSTIALGALLSASTGKQLTIGFCREKK